MKIQNRRYTGSKYKLMPWIKKLILKHCPEHDSLFDVFGGTGVVTASLLDITKKSIINDFLFSNEVIYEAFFNQEEYDESKLHSFVDKYLSIRASEISENYVSLNYGDKYFKMDEGKELIKFFCSPCSPTKTNGGRTRNLPCHVPSKWSVFKSYNKRDVEVEIEIHNRLAKYPVPDFVWDEYHLDQVINDRGINLDMTLVNSAISIDEEIRENLLNAMQNLTDLDNPNSVVQLKTWFSKCGIDVDDLGKKSVAKLKESIKNGEILEVISLRQQLSKSSVKKYLAMKNARCKDNRAHGMFQFYGANRSGRFSGRLIQLQNLPQNHLTDLDIARDLVKQRKVVTKVHIEKAM